MPDSANRSARSVCCPARVVCRLVEASFSVSPTTPANSRLKSTLRVGVLERFLDARIGNPGNMANLRQQLVGEGAVRVEVVAGDLDVDRRGRAEIENLADDVRRKEGEGRARKRLRKLLAQRLHISVGRGRPLAQTDEHIGVEDADRSRCCCSEIDAADRQADVVDDARQRSGGMIVRISVRPGRSEPRRFLDSRARSAPACGS